MTDFRTLLEYSVWCHLDRQSFTIISLMTTTGLRSNKIFILTGCACLTLRTLWFFKLRSLAGKGLCGLLFELLEFGRDRLQPGLPL